MCTRFFHAIRELPVIELARLTQIDYERAMAFVAVTSDGANADPDNTESGFAILVRSALKGKGLGAVLLKKPIHCCRARVLQRMTGEVLTQNTRMPQLATALGFSAKTSAGGCEQMVLELQREAAHPV